MLNELTKKDIYSALSSISGLTVLNGWPSKFESKALPVLAYNIKSITPFSNSFDGVPTYDTIVILDLFAADDTYNDDVITALENIGFRVDFYKELVDDCGYHFVFEFQRFIG